MIGVYVLSFIIGGLVTLAITYFELSGYPMLSRMATLFPVFTWISYFFIGKYSSSTEVAHHVLFVLLGTIVCWIPYMLTLYFLTPKVGAPTALVAAIGAFIILAIIFIKLY